jgi:2-dehydro-3-deoxyphosphooctonate aldolase (KDO 8-P synthase)
MKITLKNFQIGGGAPLVLIAGPCVVESRDLVFRVAEQVKASSEKHKIPAVFKSSYKKANRTSAKGFVGIGMDEALGFLAEVKREFDLPILTDIHTEAEASIAAHVADILQIPAFLFRQTELLQAAGKTGCVVNIKKGQFAAPEDMKFAAEKVAATGNAKVLLTERGTTFGYHDLVVDMRSLKIMSNLGYPVILDATHAVQRPGGDMTKGESSGSPEFIFPIARAGVAAGCDGLFVEVHPNPAQALSDAASQMNLGLLEELLRQVKSIDQLVRNF